MYEASLWNSISAHEVYFADTLDLSRHCVHNTENHKLNTLCKYFDIPLVNHHNYLDFKITKDEAKSQIEDVESRIIEGDSIHSIGIGADISYISFALTSPHNKSDDILEKRNDLAESIGEGIRNK